MAAKFANPSETRVSSSSDNRYWRFLVIFGLFALVFVLGGRSLENKDSVRFAEIAREILEFNDWLVLRLGGEIYVEKPVLHFWWTAGLYKLFGVSPFIARLPEATAAFGGLLITFFFTRKIFRKPQTAFLAAIILLSTYGYFFWARRTRIDIELAVFYSLSLVCFYCGLETSDKIYKALWYMGFWLATGCAFMCKAFVAFTNLAVVIPYSILVAIRPDERSVAPLLLVITSPCFLIPVLPWVIPLLKHPQFADYMQVLDNAIIMHRDKLFFTYFYDFPVKLFPASPFFFLGLWGYLRFRKQLEQRSGLVFVLLWVGIYIFILHLTSAKTARYLLPIYLPSSIVAAWAILFYLEKYPETFGKIMRWGDRFFLVMAALSLIIPFLFAYYSNISLVKPIPYVICLGVILFLTRKLLPLKAAGIFISFIMLLLSIEAADGIHNDQTSAYLRLSRTLKMQGLAPEQIGFYHCDSGTRVQWAVSYYYDKVIRCANHFNEFDQNPTIRAIVTTRKMVEKEIPWEDVEKRYRIIPADRDFIVILKRN